MEYGFILNDQDGKRIGAKRHYADYDECCGDACKASAFEAVERRNGRDVGVGEIVVLTYARTGDKKPTKRETL